MLHLEATAYASALPEWVAAAPSPAKDTDGLPGGVIGTPAAAAPWRATIAARASVLVDASSSRSCWISSAASVATPGRTVPTSSTAVHRRGNLLATYRLSDDQLSAQLARARHCSYPVAFSLL